MEDDPKLAAAWAKLDAHQKAIDDEIQRVKGLKMEEKYAVLIDFLDHPGCHAFVKAIGLQNDGVLNDAIEEELLLPHLKKARSRASDRAISEFSSNFQSEQASYRRRFVDKMIAGWHPKRVF